MNLLVPHVDPELDVGLVAQYAIVHDLTEVYAGDTSVWTHEAALATKEEREAEAMQKLEQRFSHFPWLIETLQAYERQDTPEACYIRALDKYIALCVRFMDGGYFYHREGITKEIFDQSLVTHRQKTQGHKGAAEYYELIRTEYDEHPEHFAPSKIEEAA